MKQSLRGVRVRWQRHAFDPAATWVIIPAMHFQTVVFDLDETIYPKSCGLMTAVGERIQAYCEQVTGLNGQPALTLRKQYLADYGTTLRGLQIHHHVDVEDYLAFVHDVNVGGFIRPALELDQMLQRLPQAKVIFTNGTREHAANVLRALAIERHFGCILDVRDFGYQPKPAAVAYETLLCRLPHPPQATLYVDDRIENLRPAAKLGLTTVLVVENGDPPAGVHHTIHDLLELEALAGSPVSTTTI
jgi:putative hydrolase of the HAD superfamily